MDIRTEPIPGGKAIRLIESAQAQTYIGWAIVIFALFIVGHGIAKMDMLKLFVGSIIGIAGGWGLLFAASYETLVSGVDRTIEVDVRGRQLNQHHFVSFDEVEAVEFHDRRKKGGLINGGKSYIAFLIALRLKDGSRVALSTDWGFHREGKLRAATTLSRFIGVPCDRINEELI